MEIVNVIFEERFVYEGSTRYYSGYDLMISNGKIYKYWFFPFSGKVDSWVVLKHWQSMPSVDQIKDAIVSHFWGKHKDKELPKTISFNVVVEDGKVTLGPEFEKTFKEVF